MNIFNFLKRSKNTSKSTTYTLPAYIDRSGNGGAVLRSNIDATSFAAIDLIASAFTNLQVGVYDKKTRTKLADNPVYEVLKKPNLEDTRFLFFYSLAVDYYKEGNAYIYVYRDENGQPVSIFRIYPWKVSVYKDDTGRKVFVLDNKEYTSENVIQIASRYGYYEDGLRGYSIFKECYRAFNLTESMNDYTNNLFNNGMGKRAVIDISKAYPKATDEEIKQIREKYQNMYSGIDNAGKAVVKTNGIEFSSIDSGLPDNRNQQLIENREFQQKEILKIFGIPEAMLSDTSSDIESVYLSFVERAVKPLATQFEESLAALFNFQQQRRLYIEYSYNELLKTSLQSRIDCYAKQVTNGILTPNEIRVSENREPFEAGDTPFVQANLMPLTTDNLDAYMAQSKAKLQEVKTDQEKAAQAGTNIGIGSDKL